MLRRSFLFSLTSFLAACTSEPKSLALAPNSTLIIARHIDRDESSDPLDNYRIANARELARVSKDLKVQQIFLPEDRRNLETATTLAKAIGKPVQSIPKAKITATLIQNAASGPVIWIGNQDNILKIFEISDYPKLKACSTQATS